MSRVKEGLKGDGLVFTSRPSAEQGGTFRVPASPAPSSTGGEWEAPSPLHPSHAPAGFGTDRGRLLDSQPRVLVSSDTPLSTPGSGGGYTQGGGYGGGGHTGGGASSVGGRTHVSATPLPSPALHGQGKLSGGAAGTGSGQSGVGAEERWEEVRSSNAFALTWYRAFTWYRVRWNPPRTHFEPWKAVGTPGRRSLAAW